MKMFYVTVTDKTNMRVRFAIPGNTIEDAMTTSIKFGTDPIADTISYQLNKDWG